MGRLNVETPKRGQRSKETQKRHPESRAWKNKESQGRPEKIPEGQGPPKKKQGDGGPRRIHSLTRRAPMRAPIQTSHRHPRGRIDKETGTHPTKKGSQRQDARQNKDSPP